LETSEKKRRETPKNNRQSFPLNKQHKKYDNTENTKL
jgi:hypothetical protein